MAIVQFRHVLLSLLLLAAHSAAAQTTITFEEFPARTAVRHQYGAKGVHFRGSIISINAAARSGQNALYSVSPFEEVFGFPGPMVIDFDAGQRSVSVFAIAGGTEVDRATLTAFDAAGNVIARTGPTSVPPGAVATMMQVRVPQSSIRRVELLYANDHNEVLDDLTFEGETASGLPTTPPVVTITSPRQAQEINTTTFTVRGTVTGAQVDPNGLIRVNIRRPPGSSTTAAFNFPIQLVPTIVPNIRSFTQVVSLGVGLQTITVEAENSAGLQGKASVVIDALPAAIRSRLRLEGQTAVGLFSFGSVTATAACTYAVYGNAAISSVNGATSVVRGPILAKWLALRDQGRFPQLGCSRREARGVVQSGRAQDFIGGRIYSQAQLGTFFVPPVFTAAIDALGREAGVGLPISDPTSDSRPAFKTWLFQQFAKTSTAFRSTLEIRGDPPRLVVQRQAGDGSLFTGVFRPTNPTIVESFACTTTAGPCVVTAPANEPPFTGGAARCNNKVFNWKDQVGGVLGGNPDPPEWVAIRGNNVQVPIWGVLFQAIHSTEDNPFTHRGTFEPCPPGITAAVNGLLCPSDWDLKLRPLPGFRSLQPANLDFVKVEFERGDFQHQLVGYGDPNLGDLIFASGRYVVDCGHDNYKTEIHPPAVYAAVKSVFHNGKPSTQMDLWVNRFFIGGNAAADAVEFDVYPPPRPSPQATLSASTPGDQNEAVRVTFRPVGPYGPVRVRVTATHRAPNITKYGEMKPRNDDLPFGFDGRLQVFWSCPGGC
jgi:hypothetical protein